MPSSSNPGKTRHTLAEVRELYRPLIAVYGIYMNEQNRIDCFLHSVKDADQIVLCDTGSTDGTNEIISKFQKAFPDVNLQVYQICVTPWRFDDARNTCLSLVSPEMDLCISLDTDEFLMHGWKEHLIQNWDHSYTRYNHRFKTILSNERSVEHLHDRIHSRRGYTWKLPVHEILEYNGDAKVHYLDSFWIFHTPESAKSRSSYLPLLEMSVKERSDVWISWSYLACEYLNAGRHEEALQAVDRALALENHFMSYLHQLKSTIYRAQNQVELALVSLHNAIQCMPHRREPYFNKAMYLHELGRNAEATLVLKEAEGKTTKLIDYYYNPSAWEEAFEEWKNKLLQLVREEGM